MPALTAPSSISRPARYKMDLAGLQAVCEANYRQLFKVAQDALCAQKGSVKLLSSEWMNHSSKAHLEVLEQTRYTSLVALSLTSRLHDWLTLPQMQIRLYHDVQMAEVVSADHYRNLSAVYEYPNPAMHLPDEKHQLNLLLAEWLAHFLETGLSTEPLSKKLPT
ncbi:DUF1249 domain-containing protein [Parendozoicomonas haliclonae]|uniref:DUF1249 domain-containing protein n=1 Tax=Parendozoicomonas haliclonae TaxID=1960125 RepID=UPI0013FDB49B|nr:DUF1249 domain-containing protein [Parendozoicomonas haliclonae]